MKHLFTILLSVLLGSLLLSASELQFRRYSTDQGLPSSCVRDIVQTADGFMWMATDGGVVRFDGYHFKPYHLDVSPESPEDVFALALCDCGGALFVGTDSHLYRYEAEKDTFVPFYFTCSGKKVEALEVHHIAYDHSGNIWIAATGAGAYKIDLQGNGTLYKFPEFDDYVGSVYIDSKGDVWAISNQNSGNVMLWDKKADSFVPFSNKSLQCQALAMAEDADHNLWVGTWEDGLLSFNPNTGSVLYRTDTADRQLFRHIHSVMVTPDGRLFVGSDSGLVIFDPVSRRINHYDNNILDPYSLSDKFVYPITLDHEGGIWIGTFYGGVNYLRPELKVFDRYEPSFLPNTIGCSIISDIAEDSRGNIWIASDDGGLKRFDPSTGIFSSISLGGSPSHAYNLHSMCFDGDDLWIGSYSAGVFVYNTKTGNFRQFLSDEDDVNTLMTRSSYAICRDKRSTIWVATGSWVNVYNRGTENFRRVKNLQAQIIDIDEDVDGCLWFATQGQGVWRYNPLKGEWRNYTYTAASNSLPHNHINCIALDAKNNLYFATAQGVCRYDRASDAFEEVNTGVPPTSVLSIVDENGYLWLSTEMGLVKYSVDSGCEVFTKSDGMTSSQFMPNSILRASDGKIYVGTRFGITAFYPYQIKSNVVVPRIAFTALEIPNEHNHGSGDHLPVDINHIDKIVLHPEDYTFSISFAALSFTNPEKNQYAYKLDGFDKDWIRVGSDNKATYTNLPPGEYKFQVIASNSDNIWNQAGASVLIKVLAPWYWTWPMKVLYAILIAALIYLVIRVIMLRKDKSHQVEIHRINNDKAIELYQAKLSFFTMIAHEIRTPVSLIIGPLEKIMRSSEKVSPMMSRDLTVIERNSQRLLTLVNQLLDFKKVEETGFNVTFRNTQLKPLIMGVCDRFRPTMEQKGIVLDVKYNADEDFTADIDAESITKLLSNLLNNARKFTRDYVSVSVTVNQSLGRFVIVVSDNGVGISKENQTKVFRPFYQVTSDDSQTKGGTGLGLSIVQNVVESHGGEIKVDSALDCGTSFIISLPIHQASVVADSKTADMSAEDTPDVVKETDQSTKIQQEKPIMLVVDDNEDLCTFIASSFSDRFEVITAADGIEAMDVLKTKEVAFVISDWMMPRMDGAQLCKALRDDRNISHIPFLLLTAKTDNISRIHGLNIGADAYVDKPFSLQVLQARVDNLLNIRALLRQKFSQTPLEPIASVAPNPADNEILTQLTAVIEDNFSNPDLDIDFLAAKLDISRSGLYNKIKALIDVTPNELIRITRLKHAAKLLAENRYRINEVCYMVGFNSTSYFAKCFQKQFGMTPTEFVASTQM